jgi:hypothetical protein
VRESVWRFVDHRDGGLGASEDRTQRRCASQPRRRSSIAFGTGGQRLYHLATLFHGAAGSSLRRGWDGDATVYLQRAVPLMRQIDHPYQWMLLCGNVGIAALPSGDTEAARDAFREELTLGRELVVSPVASEALTGLAAVATLENELERALPALPRRIATATPMTPW